MSGFFQVVGIIVLFASIFSAFLPNTKKKKQNLQSRRESYMPEQQAPKLANKTAPASANNEFLAPKINEIPALAKLDTTFNKMASEQLDKEISSSLQDDRKNDWFAKQLREEHRAFLRTSDMFSLKIEHSTKCDAEMLAAFHVEHCDAGGIDRGEA